METQKVTQFLITIALTLTFLYLLSPLVITLFLSAILAIVCYPFYLRVQKKWNRALSAGMVTLVVVLVFLLPTGLITIATAYKILNVLKQFSFSEANTTESFFHSPGVVSFLDSILRFSPVEIDKTWLYSQASNVFKTLLEWISVGIGTVLSSIPRLVLDFLIILVCLYFLLVDGTLFLHFLSQSFPIPEERSQALFQSFEKSCRGVVLSLVVSAAVQGGAVFFFFLITKIPDPVFLATVATIFGVVPVVGNSPITLGAAVYLFGRGDLWSGVIMIFGFLVVASLDNVIRPWILQGQSKLHPLLVLLSTIGATSLVGPVGIVLGPIISSLFLSFIQFSEKKKEVVATPSSSSPTSLL